MQQTTHGTQATGGDARQWQIKWGTRELVQVKDVIKARAFGHLEVSISNPQHLTDYLSAQDEQELSETTRGYLKDMAVQALQAALDHCDISCFLDHKGACSPECVQQVRAGASDNLRAQLAGMGFELRSFVIGSISYEHLHGSASPIDGGEECAGCRAIRIQLGLEQPSTSPSVGLGYAPELGAKILAMMQSSANPSPPASPEPDVMTLAQVAAYLQVTETEVIELIKSGQLKGEQIGSTYHITRKDLEGYLRV